eukprot:TRINITY_DN5391_c0_g1_i2.p1 TRINITY_DN5391_c0_g1~~TRINITY_DN5391_c0_g1_i2.p1  ORF type:complete len:461 (+),score=111.90 TRINITY_DN5391_c0_g1_i2:168-1550(+)
MEELPTELIETILRSLGVSSFARFTATCKTYRQYWNDDSIWQSFITRDFGQTALEEGDENWRDAYHHCGVCVPVRLLSESPSGDYRHLVKLVLLGPDMSGKSALMTRFCESKFLDTYLATIGVEFMIRTVSFADQPQLSGEDNNVKMQIWDSAGQERFQSISFNWYRKVEAFAVVYDMTNRQSFERALLVHDSLQRCKTAGSEYQNVVLVANKSDLAAQRAVSTHEGIMAARALKWLYVETSAFTGENVETLFGRLGTNTQNPFYLANLSCFILCVLYLALNQTLYKIGQEDPLRIRKVPAQATTPPLRQKLKALLSDLEETLTPGPRAFAVKEKARSLFGALKDLKEKLTPATSAASATTSVAPVASAIAASTASDFKTAVETKASAAKQQVTSFFATLKQKLTVVPGPVVATATASDDVPVCAADADDSDVVAVAAVAAADGKSSPTAGEKLDRFCRK